MGFVHICFQGKKIIPQVLKYDECKPGQFAFKVQLKRQDKIKQMT